MVSSIFPIAFGETFLCPHAIICIFYPNLSFIRKITVNLITPWAWGGIPCQKAKIQQSYDLLALASK